LDAEFFPHSQIDHTPDAKMKTGQFCSLHSERGNLPAVNRTATA